MQKTKVILDEKLICYEYLNTKIGIESIALKYHVGKLKIKDILKKNNIDIKRKGGQSNDEIFVVPNFKTKKYINGDNFTYIVVDNNNQEFSSKDIDNRGGTLTSYIEKHYGIETPTLYDRRMYYMKTGNYWWEQWLTYIKISNKPTKKCPYCEWETTDITNRSGMFETHLSKEHNISKLEYLKNFPGDCDFFTLADKRLQRRFFETDKTKYVTCKVCGEKMATVNTGHLKKHGMSVDDYIGKFGACDLICQDMHNKLSENAIQNNKEMEFHSTSNGEQEIIEFIKELGFNPTPNRKILNGLELDIFIEEKNVAIEYDGLYWHNELYKKPNYHLNKTKECLKHGIQLIHIFEDEWLSKKDIVKSRIRNILGVIDNKIFARKCIVKEVNSVETSIFLDDNHTQGKCNSSIRLGLFYKNELVSMMTFGKQRVFMGNKSKDGYEMVRFCNKINTNVIGGASKLLSHFVKYYEPSSITSYADRRWSNGNLYKKLGFTLSKETKPSYFYVIKSKRVYRFNMRKDILVSKYGCPKEVSEHEFCKSKKWYRIYDCGTLHFEYKKEDAN